MPTPIQQATLDVIRDTLTVRFPDWEFEIDRGDVSDIYLIRSARPYAQCPMCRRVYIDPTMHGVEHRTGPRDSWTVTCCPDGPIDLEQQTIYGLGGRPIGRTRGYSPLQLRRLPIEWQQFSVSGTGREIDSAGLDVWINRLHSQVEAHIRQADRALGIDNVGLATGPALDRIAGGNAIIRVHGETDEALRARIQSVLMPVWREALRARIQSVLMPVWRDIEFQLNGQPLQVIGRFVPDSNLDVIQPEDSEFTWHASYSTEATFKIKIQVPKSSWELLDDDDLLGGEAAPANDTPQFPSIFEIHDGDQIKPRYSVPGSCYNVLHNVGAFGVGEDHGAPDADLSEQLLREFGGYPQKASVMHAIGRRLIELRPTGWRRTRWQLLDADDLLEAA